MSYEHHPIAAIFPLMAEDELLALADDIAANGQHSPIEIYQGKIIDGRNRATACLMRGIEPDVIVIDEHLRDNKIDPIAYVISLNLQRRHLTPGQKAEIGVNAKKVQAELAKGREKAGKKIDPSENLHKGRASDIAAKSLGISGRTIDHAVKVFGDDAKATPELQEAVRTGKASVSAAAKVAGLPAKVQQKAVSAGKQGVAESARTGKAPEPLPKKKRYPASEMIIAATGTTGAAITRLNAKYGSFEAIVNCDEWDHGASAEIADVLEAGAEDCMELVGIIRKSIKERKRGSK